MGPVKSSSFWVGRRDPTWGVEERWLLGVMSCPHSRENKMRKGFNNWLGSKLWDSILYFLKNRLNSLYFSDIKAMWWPQQDPGPSAGRRWCGSSGDGQRVPGGGAWRKWSLRRLRGAAVGLEVPSKVALVKLPGEHCSHPQYQPSTWASCARGLDDASAPGGEDEEHQHRAAATSHLARNS